MICIWNTLINTDKATQGKPSWSPLQIMASISNCGHGQINWKSNINGFYNGGLHSINRNSILCNMQFYII